MRGPMPAPSDSSTRQVSQRMCASRSMWVLGRAWGPSPSRAIRRSPQTCSLASSPSSPATYSTPSALAEGQREIFGLGLFTLALVDMAPSAVRGDTIVPVRIRVQRGPSRVLSAFTGYFTDGGVTLRTSATHRNAFGGARQFSANVEWRTGIGSGIGPGASQSVTGGPITDFRRVASLPPAVRVRPARVVHAATVVPRP